MAITNFPHLDNVYAALLDITRQHGLDISHHKAVRTGMKKLPSQLTEHEKQHENNVDEHDKLWEAISEREDESLAALKRIEALESIVAKLTIELEALTS